MLVVSEIQLVICYSTLKTVKIARSVKDKLHPSCYMVSAMRLLLLERDFVKLSFLCMNVVLSNAVATLKLLNSEFSPFSYWKREVTWVISSVFLNNCVVCDSIQNFSSSRSSLITKLKG